MMSVQQHYNEWASTYDEVENKTRDLEKLAGQRVLSDVSADSIIELGCGTGKNTIWLAEKAAHVTAIDLSEEMMLKAKQKVQLSNVVFQQFDITQEWTFTERKADLITCSLILEHIESLKPVFEQVSNHLKENGHFYVCELHPCKQYSGSKARFETGEGTQVLQCFTHHITDFISAATENNLTLLNLDEWFDNDDRTNLPRLISFLFQKRSNS
jgi:2-polyprenyl-3-methyl-5-hydroxy-6-metoxy-1,4-benzoquinol methylase